MRAALPAAARREDPHGPRRARRGAVRRARRRDRAAGGALRRHPAVEAGGLLAFAAQAGVDAASAEPRLARHPVVDDEPAAGRPPRRRCPRPSTGRCGPTSRNWAGSSARPALVSLYDLLGLDPAARDRAGPGPRGRRRPQPGTASRPAPRPRRRPAGRGHHPAARRRPRGLPRHARRGRHRAAAARGWPPRCWWRTSSPPTTTTHLVGEAEALGLDRGRAVRAVSALARELGVAVPDWRRRAGPRRQRDPAAGPRPTAPATSVRRHHHAARAGRPAAPATRPRVEPDRGRRRRGTRSCPRRGPRCGPGGSSRRRPWSSRPASWPGGTMPPIRAVSDEVADVLAEAGQRWRAALDALAARRFTEAASNLERLLAIAADVPGPEGRSAADALAEANRGIRRRDRRAATTRSPCRAGPGAGAARRVGAAPDIRACSPRCTRSAYSPSGRAHPAGRRWRRGELGAVAVAGADRVPGPARRPRRPSAALGTTQRTELEVGRAPRRRPLPVYVVVARRAGVCSGEVRLRRPGTPGPGQPQRRPRRSALRRDRGARPTLPPPVGSLVLLPHGRRVRLVYPVPAAGRVEIRRLPDGVRPPAPGSVVPDPATCGEVVPGMGPGLAVDRRPSAPTAYVALTIDGAAVAGPRPGTSNCRR